jgi:hypothetical protein
MKQASYKAKLVNEAQILNKWVPKIKKATGIEEEDKLRWMAIYSHFHHIAESRLYENQYNNLGNTIGMGNVALPTMPTSQQNFQAAAPGSGDKPMSLLPLAMQVAGQTVGLDLLPVVPMGGPLGFLNYVDYVYAGGKGLGNDLNVQSVPFIIELPLDVKTVIATAAGLALNPNNPPYVKITSSGNAVNYIFGRVIASSRINGNLIVAVIGIYKASDDSLVVKPTDVNPNAPTIYSILDGSLTTTTTLTPLTGVTNNSPAGATAGTAYTTTAGTKVAATYVKALENVIKGFTADSESSWAHVIPYTRGKGEQTTTKSMGIKFFNKPVEARTIQVDIATTREQIQDARQFGIDIIAQANTILANELSQALNANILARVRSLGATNHVNICKTENIDFHINLATANVNLTTIDAEFLKYGQGGQQGETITFNGTLPYTAINAIALTGGETLYTVNRRLYTQVLASKNMINYRGRRGPANCLVANGTIVTAFQDVSGFNLAPMANTVSQEQLFSAGTIAGIQIFNDPQQYWSDNRMAIFRKGDGATPGLVFMPYLMAESVDTIAEATMAPKIQVKSRYEVVEAGIYPEANYITTYVWTNNGNIFR